VKNVAKLLGLVAQARVKDTLENLRAERRAWVEALIAEIAAPRSD
jgi:hypothetical protein